MNYNWLITLQFIIFSEEVHSKKRSSWWLWVVTLVAFVWHIFLALTRLISGIRPTKEEEDAFSFAWKEREVSHNRPGLPEMVSFTKRQKLFRYERRTFSLEWILCPLHLFSQSSFLLFFLLKFSLRKATSIESFPISFLFQGLALFFYVNATSLWTTHTIKRNSWALYCL